MRSEREAAVIAGRRVRLAPGRHATPREGACVVELASLIAREEFSDRPVCVCPVIGAFLRGWNDRTAYADRQRLLPYAQRIVGTRGSSRLTRERRDMCLEWAGADLHRGPIGRMLARLRMRIRIAIFCGPAYALRLTEGGPEYAARVLYGQRNVEGAFLLLDAMLAIGPRPEGGSAATTNGARNGGAPVEHRAGPEANGRPVGGGNGSAVVDPDRIDLAELDHQFAELERRIAELDRELRASRD